jgi:hypothetical protein
MASSVTRRLNLALRHHHEYGYVKSWDLWFLTKETPDRPLQEYLGSQGLYPLGMLVRTLRLRNLPKPEYANASAQGLGARPLGSCPAYDTSQGPGIR